MTGTRKPMTLPRAYLRMSPNLDQHPDPGGMVMLLCAANRQPQRGFFRDKAVLVRALGAARFRRFAARGDVQEVDGGWYVEGWEEWQEGDLTVGERQRRIRERKRDAAVTKSQSDNADVTTDPLPKRYPLSEAVDVVLLTENKATRGLTRPSSSRGARALGPVDPAGKTGTPSSWEAAQLASVLGAKP
jgi:hypothetical protein